MEIIDLIKNQSYVDQTAMLLYEGFKEGWPGAWPTLASAKKEVLESLNKDRISRIAVIEKEVVGWIGAIRQYHGNVWELHPLIVKKQKQKQGNGTALVKDLEAKVREQGGITLWAGTDDEKAMTSVSEVDLYPNVLKRLIDIKNFKIPSLRIL